LRHILTHREAKYLSTDQLDQPVFDGTFFNANCGSISAQINSDTFFASLKPVFREGLRSLLDAWFLREVDTDNGGFSCNFDHRWRRRGPKDKMLESQARTLQLCRSCFRPSRRRKTRLRPESKPQRYNLASQKFVRNEFRRASKASAPLPLKPPSLKSPFSTTSPPAVYRVHPQGSLRGGHHPCAPYRCSSLVHAPWMGGSIRALPN